MHCYQGRLCPREIPHVKKAPAADTIGDSAAAGV